MSTGTIGHPEALREWRSNEIGWWYADEDNRTLCDILRLFGGALLPDLDLFIERLEDEGAGAGQELRERRQEALRLFREQFRGKATSFNKLTDHAFAGHIEWIIRRKAEIERAAALLPLARTGKKFTDGRKAGTAGRVRKAIAAHLKKNAGDKNPQIWDALKQRPPKGWSFYDNRLGEYIEHQDGSTSRRQFNNICGEERKKIRG